VRAFLLAVLVLLTATPVRASDATLGGPGESCRARSDCQLGLKCISQICTSVDGSAAGGTSQTRTGEAQPGEPRPCQSSAECGELKCVENRCINPFGRPYAPPERGVRAFIGIVSVGGIVYAGVPGRGQWQASPSLLAAIRVGLLVDHVHELALEISPFTYAYYVPAPGPAFQINATYGYMLPIVVGSSVSVYWPFRFGAGLFTGNTGGDVYAQVRADVLGVSIHIRHLVVIDVYAPSFRYAITNVDGATGIALSWEFGAGTSFLF
jgi:hypothetical protein